MNAWVKTNKKLPNDEPERDEKCFICGGIARYWSQKGDENYRALGLAIWHCTRHTNEGVSAAEQSTIEDVLQARARLILRGI